MHLYYEVHPILYLRIMKYCINYIHKNIIKIKKMEVIGMIGNISMEEFARKVYMETGVRPQYNSFALYHNTVYINNMQLGRLYLYGTVDNRKTIKEVRNNNRISLINISKNFVTIFNHNTQKIEVFCVNRVSNVIKWITDQCKVLKVGDYEDYLLLKTDTALCFVRPNGKSNMLGILSEMALGDIEVKVSSKLNEYEIYAKGKLVCKLDK